MPCLIIDMPESMSDDTTDIDMSDGADMQKNAAHDPNRHDLDDSSYICLPDSSFIDTCVIAVLRIYQMKRPFVLSILLIY